MPQPTGITQFIFGRPLKRCSLPRSPPAGSRCWRPGWRRRGCQRLELDEDAPQRLDAKRQRITVVVDRVREQLSERRSLFLGKIELYPPDAGYDGALPGHIVEVVGFALKLHARSRSSNRARGNWHRLPRSRSSSAISLSRLRKKSVGGASSPIRRLLPFRNPLI